MKPSIITNTLCALGIHNPVVEGISFPLGGEEIDRGNINHPVVYYECVWCGAYLGDKHEVRDLVYETDEDG